MAFCFVRAELWDVPDVREFFNLAAMDQGKSYAERAHAIAGHGLRLDRARLTFTSIFN